MTALRRRRIRLPDLVTERPSSLHQVALQQLGFLYRR
jgi:hypothetical protein